MCGGCPLGALREPELVLDAAAQALGARGKLVEHIGGKKMLLLFDNFEQVIAAAHDIRALLEHCPQLDIVVTSREPLRVTGEQEYQVPPLDDNDGIALFLARARAVKSNVRMDPAVAEICRRLDGLPLALELAAARVRALSAGQILQRLGRRLPLLVGGASDLPQRQQTLRATIDWSYRLLSQPERQVFRRLAVFAGGCTLDAAERTVDADLTTVQALIEKSLVRHNDERYSMLETVREYANERLEGSGESDEVRERHANHYLALACNVSSAGEPTTMLRPELDNFRAALDWLGRAGAHERRLELATALSGLWVIAGHAHEGGRAVQDALHADAQYPPRLRARALRVAGGLALDRGDYTAARKHLEAALHLSGALGLDRTVAGCLTDLGHVAKCEGDFSRAEVLFGQSIERARTLEDKQVLAEALLNFGDCLVSKGDFERAEATCEESLQLYQALASDLGAGSALFSLGLARLHQGRLSHARATLNESLIALNHVGYTAGIACAFEAIAAIDALEGRTEQAARLIGAADVLLESADVSLEPAEHALHVRTLERLERNLGESSLERLRTQARSMPLAASVELALARNTGHGLHDSVV